MAELIDLGPELLVVARSAIEYFLQTGKRPATRRPDAPPAPVFVTLRNPDGSLRGCIGSVAAVERDVVAETARSAILAASRDPRFEPVRAEELPGLSIDVSVLLPAEPINDETELDPRRYGVVVRDAGGHQGLLLPDIPGVDTPAMQLTIAKNKAGIAVGAAVMVERFEVVKFTEVPRRARAVGR